MYGAARTIGPDAIHDRDNLATVLGMVRDGDFIANAKHWLNAL
jgi:hypothetical protein